MKRNVARLAVSMVLVIGSAGLAAQQLNLHVVWRLEAGTQLLWNKSSAYLFVSQRDLGWTGNSLQFAWQWVRNWLHIPTDHRHDSEWVTLYRLTASSVERFDVRNAAPVVYFVSNDEIYGVYQKGRAARWSSGMPVPVSDQEWRRATKERLHDDVQFTNVHGWSGRRNLLNGGGGTVRFQLELDGQTVEVLSWRQKVGGGGAKALRVVLPSGEIDEIWSTDEHRRFVSEEAYDALFKEQK